MSRECFQVIDYDTKRVVKRGFSTVGSAWDYVRKHNRTEVTGDLWFVERVTAPEGADK